MSQAPRETWGSKVGFILAAVGSAIGLGAVWKLPYVMGENGGGAFILLFLLFNLIIGLPLFIGELILGRQSRHAVVSAFGQFAKKNSSFPLIGWLIVVASLLILGWYCVVAGWGVCYVLLSLTDAFSGMDTAEISESFEALRGSGSLNILFQIIFIAFNAMILVKGISKGIEKWSKLMTSGLFLMLVFLTVYAMSLDGFNQAVAYILTPDFSKLSARGIIEALGLALFTLSLGYGVMITYGSYLKNDDDIPKTALIVVLANVFASVLVAIAIFPMIFSFGFEPQAGEGLIFKTMPYVFEQLPGSMVLSFAFFVLFLFAGLTSSLSMFEVVVANFVDLNGISRKKAVVITSLIVFVLGLPTACGGEGGIFPLWENIFGENFMKTNIALVDWFLVIIAFFTSIFVGFIMNKKVCKEGFCLGSNNEKYFFVWRFLLQFVVPVSILIVILQRVHILKFL